MNILNKLERKLGKYAIKNLMLYIVIANAIVFVFTQFNNLYIYKFALIPSAVLQGEVWRLITFIMIPPTYSPIFIIFVLYFYYMVGGALEQYWGSFRFNMYYLIGMLGTIAAAFITGMPMVGMYINLSLFFAFATLYPDFTVLLFFILPIKIKYIALFSAVGIISSIYNSTVPVRISIIVAIINYFLFFGFRLFRKTKHSTKSYVRKKEYVNNSKPVKSTFHKCEVCGRTEKDNPDLEFRYCSKCDGYYEYCSDHLFNHEHKRG